MKFRTELSPDPIQPPLQAEDKVMILGSCFAENIGGRLLRGGMAAHLNPLGIQYNPLSLQKVMAYLSGEIGFQRAEIFEHQGKFRHWDLHSKRCGVTRNETEDNATMAIENGRQFLAQSNWLYVTLGSAHVWYREERPVANCHKMPGSEFHRRRLSIDESTDALKQLIQKARRIQPDLHVLLTVSPVRYKRDGLIESQRSKSVLLLSTERVCKALQGVHYFPAYELVIDDLRDYRFFERDLVHPSDVAVDYIWEKFQQCAVSSAAISTLRAGERAWRRSQHITSPL